MPRKEPSIRGAAAKQASPGQQSLAQAQPVPQVHFPPALGARSRSERPRAAGERRQPGAGVEAAEVAGEDRQLGGGVVAGMRQVLRRRTDTQEAVEVRRGDRQGGGMAIA